MSNELQALNGKNKLAEWAVRISECRNSGQSVKTWCRENGIREQTYYRWQKRLFEMTKAEQGVQSDCRGNATTDCSLWQCGSKHPACGDGSGYT